MLVVYENGCYAFLSFTIEVPYMYIGHGQPAITMTRILCNEDIYSFIPPSQFTTMVLHYNFQFPSFKFQVSSFKFQVSSFKFQVSSSKFQVPSSKFQVPISKFQPPSSKLQESKKVSGG
ncbi:unnamed protein product [Ambrosiozyma monospora]|uniref:Unnamed protein product n=1 Tax=Ambrosiozyma monospora TaxID=43982 RepID=A0A9W6YVK2_AMBMO|nr:unnamed protein product [Ambrosiozyma monospora]